MQAINRSKAEIRKTKLGRLELTAVLLLAALVLNGCALTKAHIAIEYVPQRNVACIPGAETVSVRVDVADLRASKDKVSVKKNGYGMEMAPILADNDVAAVLKSAIETELKQRGFQVNNGPANVFAELSKFYCDFKIGFWAANAVADATMNVQIRKPDGTIAYSKIIAGEGIEPNVQLASGTNARLALNAALQNAVAQLFADPAFINCLLTSGKPLQFQANLTR